MTFGASGTGVVRFVHDLSLIIFNSTLLHVYIFLVFISLYIIIHIFVPLCLNHTVHIHLQNFLLAVLSASTCHFTLLYAWHIFLFVFVFFYQSSVLVIEIIMIGDMSKKSIIYVCVHHFWVICLYIVNCSLHAVTLYCAICVCTHLSVVVVVGVAC